MLRRLPTVLATFAFGVHSLLGCCVHHAHGREAEAGDDVCRHSHDSANHADDISEMDHVEAAALTSIEIPHPPGECPPVQCNEARCEYLVTAGEKAPHPDDASAPVHLADSMASLAMIVGSRVERPQECEPLWQVRGERCAPIATQVWRL